MGSLTAVHKQAAPERASGRETLRAKMQPAVRLQESVLELQRSIGNQA